MNPKITVFMPVYNTEKYLNEAIESILNQTYKNFEFLIIDDGSTDDSLNIIKSFKDDRIRVYANKVNKGLPYTRNLGLTLANGKYIAFMDSDDISELNRLEIEVRFLEKNKEYDIVSSKAYIGKKNINKIRNKNLDILNLKFMVKNVIINSTAMLRMDFIKKYNIRYRKECFVAQDYSFWVDCAKYTNIVVLSDYLLTYRIREDNITNISLNKKSAQRKDIIDRIRIRALNNNGIYLSSEEYEIYNKVFSDPVIEVDTKDYYKCKYIIKKMILSYKNSSKKKFYDEIIKEYLYLIYVSSISILDKFKIVLDREIYPNFKEYTKSIIKVIVMKSYEKIFF